MKRVVFILLAGFVAGCFSGGDSHRGWIGRDESELVKTNGEPDSTVFLKDGRKVLSWTSFENSRQVISSGRSLTRDQIIPCRHSFVISVKGKVEKQTSSNCSAEQIIPEHIRLRPAVD